MNLIKQVKNNPEAIILMVSLVSLKKAHFTNKQKKKQSLKDPLEDIQFS